MRIYYERYSVDWDAEHIAEMTQSLDNLDILLGDSVIGVLRLHCEGDSCYLRDLQIMPSYQNRGFGKIVLNETKRRATNLNLNKLRLKVFKVSPAVNLYLRNGFIVEGEDERFYNMIAEEF